MSAAYDTRKRALASAGGDLLDLVSLVSVLQNMWPRAEAQGIGLQVMSVFSGGAPRTR